jgi:hypothetical protein
MSRHRWTLVSFAMLLVACAAPERKSGATDDAEAQEIMNRLASRKIDVDFRDMPLENALATLQGITGTDIILSENAKQAHQTETVNLMLSGVSVMTVLKIMLWERQLTWVCRDGLIQVVPMEDLKESGETDDAKAREIKNILASELIGIDICDTPLEDALGFIPRVTGCNVALSKSAKERYASDGVTLQLDQVSVMTVLKTMLEERQLTLVYRKGLLLVLPVEDLKGERAMW